MLLLHRRVWAVQTGRPAEGLWSWVTVVNWGAEGKSSLTLTLLKAGDKSYMKNLWSGEGCEDVLGNVFT